MKYASLKNLALFVMLLLSACSSKKEEDAALQEKKTALAKLKAENGKTDAEIARLQKEIADLDTTSIDPAKIKLVVLSPVISSNFDHFIELQGKIEAENSAYISPTGMGGQVKQVFVKQGQYVRKGQLLLKLDNSIMSQQVNAAQQQAQGIRTQLTLAKSLYERQKNLWEKGIGTEVQLLQAQTNVTSLENQLDLVAKNVNVAKAQLNTANVYADVSGIADVVNIRPGETFQGMTAAGPQIKIVNTSSLKVVSSIPENYLGKVNTGSAVIVNMPDINRTYNTTVSYIGASIDAISRGFTVEAKLPSDASLKPNQIAIIKIKDYSAANAIAVPLKVLQNDQNGKFVMVAVKDKEGMLIAKKRMVTAGRMTGEQIEITTGLQAGDQIVTGGYSGLYEGQHLKTSVTP